MLNLPKHILIPDSRKGWNLFQISNKKEENNYEFFKKINGHYGEIPNNLPAKCMIVYGISNTLWLTINTKNDEPEIIKGIINLQLEQLDISSAKLENEELIYQKIKQNSEKKEEIYTICILDESRPLLPLIPIPLGCQISANLLPIPNYSGAVWQEFGQLILAFKGNNAISHAQVLSSKKFEVNTVHEINLAFLIQLKKNIFPNKSLSEFKIWLSDSQINNLDEKILQSLAKKINCKVYVETPPSPSLKLIKNKNFTLLKPHELKKKLKSTKNRKRILFATVSTLTVFIVYFGFSWFPILKLKKNIKNLEKKISNFQIPFNELKSKKKFNILLEKAYKPETYAVEKFHQFSQLLPDSGVRFTSLKLDIEKGAVITGEAASLPLALNFKNKLKKSKIGTEFKWYFPQPNILRTGIAKFQAEGKKIDYTNE